MPSSSGALSVFFFTSSTLLASLTFNCISLSSAANYTGHAIVKIPLNHVKPLVPNYSADLLNGTHIHHSQLEVLWTGEDSKNSSFAVVRVPPEKLHRLVRSVPRHQFVIPNLQEWIDGHHRLQGSASENDDSEGVYSSLVSNFRLDRYHPLHEVNRFIDEVSKDSEQITAFDLGTTHEGRPIKALEIIGNPQDKRLIWIDGCTHAREWITVATALYLIEQVVSTKARANFVVVPVLNPDGYEYTWSTDRLWRKNRRPMDKRAMSMRSTRASSGDTSACIGVDLNRNYDMNFGGVGASSNPCSHLYSGPNALSEPEVRSVANLLWAVKDNTQMFISLHSFNQLWSCPFAYTKSPTPHASLHMDVLRTIQDAVYRTNGVTYKIGPLSTALYVGSGFALDWAYSNARIVHSYLVELRDEGHYGFLLPVEQIMPTATETWNGIAAAIAKVYGPL